MHRSIESASFLDQLEGYVSPNAALKLTPESTEAYIGTT
jgi:hypothetical protein